MFEVMLLIVTICGPISCDDYAIDSAPAGFSSELEFRSRYIPDSRVEFHEIEVSELSINK